MKFVMTQAVCVEGLSKLEGNAFNQTPYDSDGNMYMV